MDAIKAATADLRFEPPEAESSVPSKHSVSAVSRDPVSLHYYMQQVPRLTNNDLQDPFPYIVVRMLEGTRSRDPDEMSECQVAILIGVRNSSPENEAYASAANVVERIVDYFAVHPETDHFLLSANSIEWGLTGDEESWPYSGGYVVTRWRGIYLTHEEEEYV